MKPALALNLGVVAILVAAFFFVMGTVPSRAEGCGVASFYGAAHHGKLQANGRPFDMHAMTAAMWGVPFGSRYRVTHKGKSVVVTITDRGPAKRLGRAIDMSQAAFAKLAPLRQGLISVCLTRIR